jgi:asparagine synthase (glutamine-hydrolysing)
MSNIGVKDIRTVTLGFKEFLGTRNDETVIAKQVAQHYGTQHCTQWVKKEDFSNNLDRLLSAMDQPSIDGVNSYFVCKAAHDAGLKVIISGLGGDELFGGYSDFHELPIMVKSLRCFSSARWLGRGLRFISAPILKQFTSVKYAGLLEYGSDYGGAYLLRRGMYMPWELPDVLDADLVREGWRELQLENRLRETVPNVRHSHMKVSALVSGWYMRNQLLRDCDWASMAHSLELRVPLVDVELFRSVIKLIAAGHSVSKLDMAKTPSLPLPDSVINRQKTGFSIPVREWLMDANTDKNPALGRGLRPFANFVMKRAFHT